MNGLTKYNLNTEIYEEKIIDGDIYLRTQSGDFVIRKGEHKAWPTQFPGTEITFSYRESVEQNIAHQMMKLHDRDTYFDAEGEHMSRWYDASFEKDELSTSAISYIDLWKRNDKGDVEVIIYVY